MILTNTLSDNLGLADAAVIALLGYVVVFFGLILLMAVVIALGKAFSAKKEKEAAPEPVFRKVEETPVAPAAVQATAVDTRAAAPGSAGKLKLHDVEPKTAAMLMAIVANKMGKPLNELRFISIKEVK